MARTRQGVTAAILLAPTRRELLAATPVAGAISMFPRPLRAAAGGDAIHPFHVEAPFSQELRTGFRSLR
ncbi:hypothetical protein [Sinorhizobium fredii]|uniref:hypothetical protein n=1 Tax=Rhizobium fredii TaxID=380 RepID=UPI0035120516